ncbi:glycosyltransferase family 2 protein [Aegicerativicinus sediminis]|uniref:glycosyltransferase family 2 protein n=1 Tax=Aegicerativicinus sediminis TaxID=2893202 RepID=UPI001E5AA92F|nr:glycosyltransferase [Aegicerativicinus sediminis]
MESPKISVIMAVYNGEPYISDTIKSVLNQTFEDFEFIIVNDCSTDTTKQTIEGFSDERIILINNDNNLGSSRAGNKGIEAAKGEFIARIDADDLISENRLEIQYQFLKSYPEIGILGSRYKILGTEICKDLVTCPDEIAVKLFLGQNCIAHSTVMMRSELFWKHGLNYNPDNPVSQDYELWVNSSKVVKISNLPDYLMEYRIHDNQISTKRFKEQQEHAKRIVTDTLRTYYPQVSSSEIMDHYKLLGFEKVEISDLENLISWANFLIEINDKVNRFDKVIFEEYVIGLKDHSITQVFNTSFILAPHYSPKLYVHFLKAKKRFAPNLDSKIILKFMLKCFLFQTRKKNLS